MAKRKRLVVVNVTLQSSEWDYDEKVSLAGRDYRLIRIGTSGDLEAAEDLVWQWSLKADAIAVTGAREAKASGLFSGDPNEIRKVRATTTRVPITWSTRSSSWLAEPKKKAPSISITRTPLSSPGSSWPAGSPPPSSTWGSGRTRRRLWRARRWMISAIDKITPAPTASAPPPHPPEGRYSRNRPRVGNFSEHTWGTFLSLVICSPARCRRRWRR